MNKKNVDDYLTEGMYGTRRPKEAERQKFLGTLRERIVIALTIGQVMTDSGISQLEEAMKKNAEDTHLLINGSISYRFLTGEKALANKYKIPYTLISNENVDTDIGVVLTYSHAINKESIFIEKDEKEITEPEDKKVFFSKFKNWFT